jgi:hypothetical protein
MGWRLLDFNYVRPPLRPGTAPIKNLLLSVFLTPRIPRTPYEQQVRPLRAIQGGIHLRVHFSHRDTSTTTCPSRY